MVVRRAAVLAFCLVMSVTTAPSVDADPDAEPAAAAAPPADGRVPSADPVILNTPDGWNLGLGAKDEMQIPVAPLTTAISSREYLSSGIFVGSLKGPGQPRGVLEVGYEIGCGIDMSTSNGVTMAGSAGLSPGLGLTGLLTGAPGLVPLVTAPTSGVLTVGLKPGPGNRGAGGQERVQGCKSLGHDQQLPRQDRRMRGSVIHPLLRDSDSSDR